MFLRSIAPLGLALTFAPLLVSASGCGTTPDPPEGSGTVAGTFDGRAFDHVAASYRIGSPDDPVRTVVLYIFDQAVGCNEISESGWDENVTDHTQALEMKLIGTTAGTYAVVGSGAGAGDADVNYTLTSTSGTPSEVSASGGSVVVATLDGNGASGQFDLTFPSGDTLTGTFQTSYCADGREP